MSERNRREGEDWAERGFWERGQGPSRNYGWDRNRFRQEEWQKPGPYSGVGPRGYRRADEHIFEDVCEILTRHGRIDARDIEVNVKDGEVYLKGSVRDRQTKRMAEYVIDRLPGIKDIHNQLRIKVEQSGQPGGGRGRVDQVGGSGVYPASGPLPGSSAETQGMASWGQGERGAAGYEESGESELHIPRESREDREDRT